MLKKPAIAATAGVLALIGALAFAAPASASPSPVATLWPTTAGSNPENITSGPDGNLWFTEAGTNSVGRVTTSGVVSEFPIPTAAANPAGITSGPDGNIWFTEGGVDKVGRITPAGVITEFPLTAGTGAEGIVAASDGNLWIAEGSVSKIAVVDTAGTVLHEYATASASDYPYRITVGSDGNVWYTNFNGASIGTTDITTGASTDYPIGGAITTTDSLALGSDGNVWFTTNSLSVGGNISPTGSVSILAGMDDAGAVANGPDGNLRTADNANGTIDTVTTAGANIAQYANGTTFPPSSLVTGPDGNIWFTVNDSVGVLNLNPSATPTTPVPGLASTGVNAGPYLLVGGVLVLAGLALAWVVWFRRRRAG